MKKILVILSMLAICIIILTALEQTDDLDDYEIIVTMSENKNSCISIQFVEKSSKSVLKTLNMTDDNPYIQQGFEPIRDSKKGDVYIPVSLLNNYPLRNDLQQFYNAIAVNGKIEGRSNPQAFFSEDKNYIGINFGFGMLGPDSEYEPSFSTTYIKIYNSKGVLVYEVEFKDRGCGSPLLSNDAEYLGFRFRKTISSTSYPFQDGFAVYDLTQNKLIIEDIVPEGFTDSDVVLKSDKMIYTFYDSEFFEFVCHDLEKQKTYKKFFKREKYFRLKAIETDGLIFGLKSKKDVNTEFCSYENDFDVFKW